MGKSVIDFVFQFINIVRIIGAEQADDHIAPQVDLYIVEISGFLDKGKNQLNLFQRSTLVQAGKADDAWRQ